MAVNSPGRRKRKRPTFVEAAAQYERKLLDKVLPRIIRNGAAYVAIGVDMASQEGNWGLSIITLRDDRVCGTLRLLLPHRFKVKGFDGVRSIKPSSDFLFGLLSGLRERQITTVVAVDIPFGWSLEHPAFLENWSALNANQLDLKPLPTLDQFKFRLCDLSLAKCLKEQGRSPALFAVGADRIASAAFRWAQLRSDCFHRLGTVDLGFQDSQGQSGIVFFETYPSAFVRLNYSDCTEYKTGKADLGGDRNDRREAKKLSQQKARQQLTKRIVREYTLSYDGTENCAHAACSTSGSDAFDGFLCAITAWDYLKWKLSGSHGPRMSSPSELLGCEGAKKERSRVEKEGWILVRLPEETPPDS
jgi:hypothetical protein